MYKQDFKPLSTRDSIAIIFDDHLLFVDAFSTIIEKAKLFRSIQAFSKEDKLIDYIISNNKKSIYVFLDYFVYETNSLLLFNEIKRLNKSSRIIFCSSVQTPSIIQNVLTYQPNGFISKSSGIDTVLECIKTIESGQQYICPVIQESVNAYQESEKVNFTARELDLLQYFAQGLSIGETADKTFLSRHTIVAHRRNMMAKADCKSITELLAYSRKMEFI